MTQQKIGLWFTACLLIAGCGATGPVAPSPDAETKEGDKKETSSPPLRLQKRKR